MNKIIFIILLAISYDINAESIISLDKIKQIESSNNPSAYNKRTKATGLYQITPICLKDYNIANNTFILQKDLFNPIINTKIAKWYFDIRIPQLLRHYKKPVTVNNILIAYNAGIVSVIRGKIPTESKNYIKKYGVL